MTLERISSLKAVLIFLGFTSYFYLLLYTLLPFLKHNFILNSSLYWFITGLFLFIPIFISPILLLAKDNHISLNLIREKLHVKAFSKKDWYYATSGLLLVFLLSGIIYGISFLFNNYFNVRMINASPWFIEVNPYVGIELLYLLIWLPMFFFNIVGEEILWRGYIQSRLNGKYSWILCSVLWLVFHIPFGINLMIILFPVIILIPYLFYKTQNTSVGIFIHGLYNGPAFIAIALGFLK